MTEHNMNKDTTMPKGPADQPTDVKRGAAITTSDHDGGGGPSLAEFLDDLAKAESGKGDDAKTLRELIGKFDLVGRELRINDNPFGNFTGTLLHLAVQKGLLEAATQLVRAKADLNAKDTLGHTALFLACYRGQIDMVKLLLEKRAEAKLFDENQRTPIQIAAKEKHKPSVGLLQDYLGWDLEIDSDRFGMTPLHVAAMMGHEPVVRYLRDQGANLDHQNIDGWTPLMTATLRERETALIALLERRNHDDVQLETKDIMDRTPLMYAAGYGFLGVARLLVEAGARCDRPKAPKSTDTNPALAKASSRWQHEDIVPGLPKQRTLRITDIRHRGANCVGFRRIIQPFRNG